MFLTVTWVLRPEDKLKSSCLHGSYVNGLLASGRIFTQGPIKAEQHRDTALPPTNPLPLILNAPNRLQYTI